MSISVEFPAVPWQKAVERCWSESASWLSSTSSIRVNIHHSFMVSSTEAYIKLE